MRMGNGAFPSKVWRLAKLRRKDEKEMEKNSLRTRELVSQLMDVRDAVAASDAETVKRLANKIRVFGLSCGKDF